MSLYLVNYRHASSAPAESITRLPLDEAKRLAEHLYHNSVCKAHRRFGPSFVHYYEDRQRVERWLYHQFQILGGKPQSVNPLYFTLQPAETLAGAFDTCKILRLNLDAIADEHISFTFGDSMALYYEDNLHQMFTKKQLLDLLASYDNDFDAFMYSLGESCSFIEAQLWHDMYCIEKRVNP